MSAAQSKEEALYVLKWNSFKDLGSEKSKGNRVLHAAIHIIRKCGEKRVLRNCCAPVKSGWQGARNLHANTACPCRAALVSGEAGVHGRCFMIKLFVPLEFHILGLDELFIK